MPSTIRRALLGLLVLVTIGCNAAPAAHRSAGSPSTPATASATPSPTLPPTPGPSPTPSPAAASPSPSPRPSPKPSPRPSTATIRVPSAIQPDNKPTGIPGATNGEVDQSLLIYVDPNCIAYRPDATSLGRMFTIARAEGVSLAARECYRPLATQALDRTNNCNAGNCACAAPVQTNPTGGIVGTSMHGWGEAVDLADAQGSVNTFTSPTYAWLTRQAAQFGWNHPGWAVPGGSACPEPWHWEWVGDGGVIHAPSVRADVVSLVPSASGQGYAIVTGLGAVSTHGDAGGTRGPNPALTRLVAAGAADPAGAGFWLADAGGAVEALGGAPSLGSLPPSTAVGSGPTIATLAPTPSGQGYWLVSTTGQVFAFGDAPPLNAPAGTSGFFVGAASTGSGKGLWLAASNGQVVSLGDAQGCGPAPSSATDPIVGIASTPGNGCWLVSARGVVTAFGDAPALGSAPPTPAEPVVAIVATRSGHGYRLVTADGSVYAFGDAGYFGNG